MRRHMVVLPRERAKSPSRDARGGWRGRPLDVGRDRRRYEARLDMAPWEAQPVATQIYSLAIGPIGSRRSASKSQRTASARTPPVQRYFEHRAGHGSEVKDYGLLDDDAPEHK